MPYLNQLMDRGRAARQVLGGLPPSRQKQAALSYVGAPSGGMLRGSGSPTGSSYASPPNSLGSSIAAGFGQLGQLATSTAKEVVGGPLSALGSSTLSGSLAKPPGLEKLEDRAGDDTVKLTVPAVGGPVKRPFNPGYNWTAKR